MRSKPSTGDIRNTAVRLVTERGQPTRRVATRFGLPHRQLSEWVHAASAGPAAPAPPPKATPPDVSTYPTPSGMSVDFLRIAHELVGIGSYIINLRTNMLYGSPEMSQLLGCGDQPMEIPYDEYRRRFYAPDDYARVSQTFDAYYASGLPVQLDTRLIRADGKEIWVRTASVLRPDDHGDPVRVGMLRDVTQEKIADDALRESERQYRELVENANSIIVRWMPDGRIAYMNGFGLRFFGYNETEIRGRDAFGIVVTKTMPERNPGEFLQAIMNTRNRTEIVAESERRNGERAWIAWTNQIITDKSGEISEILSIGSDVTEHEREELYTKVRLQLTDLSYAELDMESFMRRVLDEVEALTGSRISFFHFVDDDQTTISLQAWSTNTLKHSCTAEGNGRHYAITEAGIWADGIRRGEACVYNDYPALPNRRGLPPGHAPVTRLISLPIKRNGHVVAAIGVGNKPTDYTEHDVEMLARVAATTFDCIERKRAEERLRESEARFRSAFMTGAVAFVIVEEATGRLLEVNDRFLELYGYTRAQVMGRTSLELGLWAQPSDRKGLLEKLRLHGRVENFEVLARRRDGETFWVLYSVNRLLMQGEPHILGAILDITERKQAEAIVTDYAHRLEGTLESTLQAVSSMVEMRDPYTAGHERRVGLIAADIAREMGWAESKCHELAMIGLVHDIGKIAIPAEILTKPGRLTPLEYEMIKTHAASGYEILKNIRSPMPVAEIVHQHHERMDGSGYPLGLTGDRILIEARILAVADVLESMASHRPYRPALGVEAALTEIQRHRGGWFDESVVDAMLRLVRERGYSLPS